MNDGLFANGERGEGDILLKKKEKNYSLNLFIIIHATNPAYFGLIPPRLQFIV